MYVISVPEFADNYLWLLHDGKHALAVKLGNAGQVMAARNSHGPDLKSILVTEQHPSHRGSVPPGKRAARPHDEAACRTRWCISAKLRFPFTCEPDNHTTSAVRYVNSLACSQYTALAASASKNKLK